MRNPLKAVSYFHSFTCTRIFERTESLTNHLYNHMRLHDRHNLTVSDTTSERGRQLEDSELCASSSSNVETLSYECETCLKRFSSNKSLRNHIKYIHVTTDYINANRFLRGVCVDPRQGLYLVRRSFSGTSHPGFHSFEVDGGFSCELDECREFSKKTRRSRNPNFMCYHIKSVQYVTERFNLPPTISRTVLEELIGKVKWLKKSRQQKYLQSQAVAKNSKVPLLVEFCNSKNVSSTRYQHFSVYAGEIHHSSRFKRVVVFVRHGTKQVDLRLLPHESQLCAQIHCKVVSVPGATWWFIMQWKGTAYIGNHREQRWGGRKTEWIRRWTSRKPKSNGNAYGKLGRVSTDRCTTSQNGWVHSFLQENSTTSLLTHDADVEAFPRILVPTEEVCGNCEGVALSELIKRRINF